LRPQKLLKTLNIEALKHGETVENTGKYWKALESTGNTEKLKHTETHCKKLKNT
jgi:hypothetical protein